MNIKLNLGIIPENLIFLVPHNLILRNLFLEIKFSN